MATGSESTAWGNGSEASGSDSTAFSRGVASGTWSTAWSNGRALGSMATAFNDGTAEGTRSFSAGFGSNVKGHQSSAIGSHNWVLGDKSAVIGNYVRVTGANSVAIGLGRDRGVAPLPDSLPELADDRTFAVLGGKMKICNDYNNCIDDLQKELQQMKDINADLLERLEYLEQRLN
ncbi:hypothetical protein AT251_22385 [Enterovibrio nigricans]|nr:hypothetical protein AT251_22385 [Enterovibrio nigricans]